MKILLDHCVPKPFGRELAGHEVRTAYQMGWSELTNGALLARAAERFDVLVTVDQNIQFQQNLESLALPVILLVVTDVDPESLRPYAVPVIDALSQLSGPDLICVHRDGRITKRN